MTKINPLIAIAIPTWGKVSITWASKYRNLGGPLGANTMELAHVVGKPIAEARNELMMAAIDNGCDFVFFLGDDVLAPADTINHLLQRMWDNPGIGMVTGMYWTKQWPTSPYIWRGFQRGPYMDWKHGEFFPVDYAGCDCLMIRLTPEMRELGPEWFSVDWTWEEEVDENMTLLSTEDFYFYTKTRRAGMKVWCDTRVQCIHEDRVSGMQYGLVEEMPQFGAIEQTLPEAQTDEAPLVKIAELGAGKTSPFFGHADKVKVVRYDKDEAVNPDFRCDIRRIPAADKSFDVVHSRHVLEHFGRAEVMKVLQEWTRILRVGGEFRLSVPNILAAITSILLMEEGLVETFPYSFWQLYGEQKDESDFHLNGFTPKRIQLLMERLDIFEDIEVTTGDGDNKDMNVYVKATKVRHATKHALLPGWDAIEEAEGITMPGRTNGRAELEETLAVMQEA